MMEHESLFYGLRKRVVGAVEQGYSGVEIVKMLGVSLATIKHLRVYPDVSLERHCGYLSLQERQH